LVPVERAPGEGAFGFNETAGVRVWANGAAWRGQPSNLHEFMTPISVTIENHSGRQVRLTTKDFSLLGTSGVRYVALPPIPRMGTSEAHDAEKGQIVLADYHPAGPVRPAPPPVGHHSHRKFWIVVPPPPLPRPPVIVPPWPVWPHPWRWYDPGYHARWYATWPAALSTDDMVRLALPDGVLDDDGQVSGFVYFQHAGREPRVTLAFELHDADTGADMGVARLNFVIER
jgi:hypothetical protein